MKTVVSAPLVSCSSGYGLAANISYLVVRTTAISTSMSTTISSSTNVSIAILDNILVTFTKANPLILSSAIVVRDRLITVTISIIITRAIRSSIRVLALFDVRARRARRLVVFIRIAFLTITRRRLWLLGRFVIAIRAIRLFSVIIKADFSIFLLRVITARLSSESCRRRTQRPLKVSLKF